MLETDLHGRVPGDEFTDESHCCVGGEEEGSTGRRRAGGFQEEEGTEGQGGVAEEVLPSR